MSTYRVPGAYNVAGLGSAAFGCGWLLLWLAASIGTVWVAIHFISKFW